MAPSVAPQWRQSHAASISLPGFIYLLVFLHVVMVSLGPFIACNSQRRCRSSLTDGVFIASTAANKQTKKKNFSKSSCLGRSSCCRKIIQITDEDRPAEFTLGKCSMTQHTLMGKRYASIVLQRKWKCFFLLIGLCLCLKKKKTERETTALKPNPCEWQTCLCLPIRQGELMNTQG